jgi:prepilin-type N-terminal cleavage/methylation domain-containing protein
MSTLKTNPRPAFTLIETLAVVVLFSLATTLGLWSLVGAGEAARLGEAASLAREADALARLWARGGQSVELVSTDSELIVASSAGPLTTLRLPASVRVEFALDSGPASDPTPGAGIRFDRAGRSPDYRVLVRGSAAAKRFAVAGITGLFVRIDPGSSPTSEAFR